MVYMIANTRDPIVSLQLVQPLQHLNCACACLNQLRLVIRIKKVYSLMGKKSIVFS